MHEITYLYSVFSPANVRQKVAVLFTASIIPSEHLESRGPPPIHIGLPRPQGHCPCSKGFWNMAWPHLLPPDRQRLSVTDANR